MVSALHCAVGLAAALLGATLALAEGAPPPPPNLLLISVDTLRADHTSPYAYERDTTPGLARLAEEGTLFSLAYAPAPTTGPTHATLFTGRHPPGHGLLMNGMALPRSSRTLAELLSGAGYQTAAVVSSFVLDERFGLAEGFGHYEDDFDPAHATMQVEEWQGQPVAAGFDRRADETTRRALRWTWLERDPGRPFFLFVHYFDPHAPYAPPEPFAGRFVLAPSEPESPRAEADAVAWRKLARYDGEVAFVDREISRLLDELRRAGLLDRTLVAVTADHGEGLMQHGTWLHGSNVYEEAVRVPLLLRWPGVVPAGRRVAEPVGVVDLAPTLLDLLGVEAEGVPFDGRSLAPVLRGEESLDADRPVFLHLARVHVRAPGSARERLHELHGVRAGRWKLIAGSDGGSPELYDLAADPEETTDVHAAHPSEVARLSGLLSRWTQGHEPEREAPEISQEVRRVLEALGYTQRAPEAP